MWYRPWHVAPDLNAAGHKYQAVQALLDTRDEEVLSQEACESALVRITLAARLDLWVTIFCVS